MQLTLEGASVLEDPPFNSVVQAREVPPLERTTLSVLTTLPIFYAICMRKHRNTIRNVVEGMPLPDREYKGLFRFTLFA